MKSPLVDIAAILMCILLVVLVGQYYIHKKASENNSLHQIEKREELKSLLELTTDETCLLGEVFCSYVRKYKDIKI